jgi:hypothetical protein
MVGSSIANLTPISLILTRVSLALESASSAEVWLMPRIRVPGRRLQVPSERWITSTSSGWRSALAGKRTPIRKSSPAL